MDRKGRTFNMFLRQTCFACIYMMVSCSPEGVKDMEEERRVRVAVHMSELDIRSKGYKGDTMKDICLIVFDHEGRAERCIAADKADNIMNLDLILGRTYSFYAFADFGYRIYADHISEMDELTYHLAVPEDIRTGQPMSGCAKDVTIAKGTSVMIPMKRLGARISVTMDRSNLSEDVSMKITDISIRNSPRQVTVFRENSPRNAQECFSKGYSLREAEVSPLNLEDNRGRSGTVSLFMLENMQGDLADIAPKTDRDKIFSEDDPRRETCSYVEINLEYLSHGHFNNEGPLIYRFYLGDGPANVDIERNCHYRLVISPEGDGLTENSWRVDKTYISEFGASRFAAFPESYIQGEIGDTLHLYCEFYPPHTPFSVGIEELEYDRAQGIYDYIIDEDGHGVRLVLSGPGTGIVYMEAGEPVNEAAMWIIEVNMPVKRQNSTDNRMITYTSQCMISDTTSIVPEYLQRPGFRLHRQLQVQGQSPSPPH